MALADDAQPPVAPSLEAVEPCEPFEEGDGPWPEWRPATTYTMLTIGLEEQPPTATVMWRHMVLPQVAAAVVSYVPTAIEYVDDVDLPLPTAGFAERIEELIASRN
ncbi:hypothetical protein [Streptomyces youssoufiensis]